MSETVKNGRFVESLTRAGSQIRKDRAQAIGEDAEISFRRECEDLERNVNRLKRQRENMLDMSPDNAMSLKLATNFNADEFVQQYNSLGVDIRNEEIKLEIARKGYAYLFGTFESKPEAVEA